MSPDKEYGSKVQAGLHDNPEPSAHELLNRAIEWQQYIKGISEFITESLCEEEPVKYRHVALALETISSLAKMGVECTMQAHVQMCREQLRLATMVGAEGETFQTR